MEIDIPIGFALIVSDWGYHVTKFEKAKSGNIRFYSNDDLGNEWSFSHYHPEYDVYYRHNGFDLESAFHVIGYGPSLKDVSTIVLPHDKSSFAHLVAGVPDVMLGQLYELAEGRGNHAEFSRKREVLCSFPILYKTFLETGSVKAAQEVMLARLEALELGTRQTDS